MKLKKKTKTEKHPNLVLSARSAYNNMSNKNIKLLEKSSSLKASLNINKRKKKLKKASLKASINLKNAVNGRKVGSKRSKNSLSDSEIGNKRSVNEKIHVGTLDKKKSGNEKIVNGKTYTKNHILDSPKTSELQHESKKEISAIKSQMNITYEVEDKNITPSFASESTKKENINTLMKDVSVSKYNGDNEKVYYKDDLGEEDLNSEEDGIIETSFDVEEKVIKGNKQKKKILNQEEKEMTRKEIRSGITFEMFCDNNFKDAIIKEADSKILGKKLFEWIIYPMKYNDFKEHYWEKKCLYLKSSERKRYKGLLSTLDIDEMLRKNNLMYTKNIDITSYKSGKRRTHNPEGRAYSSVVWDYYKSGCSVRILNPQTFHRPVWRLLSALQEFFNSFCGANVYLTPPGTQGFAPHWDDIEAFILQLEGSKLWKVYKPRDDYTLARQSSGNFSPEDDLGGLVLETALEPGDLLYFPRGFIHQGKAVGNKGSLHITISTYQKNCWADLLEKLLPVALQTAISKDVSFREGLPKNYLSHFGIAYAEKNTAMKSEIAEHVKQLVVKMLDYAPIDEAVDQMAKGFIHDSLPPYLTSGECKRSIFEGGNKWSKETCKVDDIAALNLKTEIRLIRRGCVRLLVEDSAVKLFYSVDNSLEYHAEEPKYVEVEPELAVGVEYLVHQYPQYVSVEQLPLQSDQEKKILANALWKQGLLVTSQPLKSESQHLKKRKREET